MCTEAHFHKTPAISTPEKLFNPLAICQIASMLQINGREIFQKERVDKVITRTGNGTHAVFQDAESCGWNRESSYNERNGGSVWGARAERFADPDASEVTISCDLEAEPDLRKIGKSRGAKSRKRNRPFAFFLNPPHNPAIRVGLTSQL
jgi:hypothetical protein